MRCASRPGRSDSVVQRVVEREGVVAVVEIDVHRGQIDPPVVLEIESQLAADGGFAATVGVVPPEESVVPEPIDSRRCATRRQAEPSPPGWSAPPACTPAPHRPSSPVIACVCSENTGSASRVLSLMRPASALAP